MREALYRAIYYFALGTLPVSLVLYACAAGILPFGISFAWTSEGAGTSLVLLREQQGLSTGDRIAHAEGTGSGYEVGVYTLGEPAREDGELVYRSVSATGENITLPARELRGRVLGTIPLAGVWVRALGHPIGLMGLIGVPVLMWLLNFVMYRIAAAGRVSRTSERCESRKERKARRKDMPEYDEADDDTEQFAYREPAAHRAVEEEDTHAHRNEASPPTAHQPMSEGLSVRIPPRRRSYSGPGTFTPAHMRDIVAREHRYGI